MGHRCTINISASPTILAQKILSSPEHSIMSLVTGLTKQTVRVPRASSSPIGHTRLTSTPVTPDPYYYLKSTARSEIYGGLSTVAKAKNKSSKNRSQLSHPKLNKFVRRLHDMLIKEKHSGIVEWRRGLLVLFSTDAFSKKILPRYFNTRNFKTFRRQLNYYGFVHVRSFSATGNTTTALWINQILAQDEANDDVSAVLKLRRVEPDEVAKTVEGRRLRKELAIHTVEEDIGLNSKTLKLNQIRSMAIRREDTPDRQGPSYATVGTPITFLAPRHKSQNYDSCSTNITSNIHQVPGSSSSSSSSGATTIYSSSDEASASESSSGFVASMKKPEDEVANTDAAASVLLMLSRS